LTIIFLVKTAAQVLSVRDIQSIIENEKINENINNKTIVSCLNCGVQVHKSYAHKVRLGGYRLKDRFDYYCKEHAKDYDEVFSSVLGKTEYYKNRVKVKPLETKTKK
jgi:hypothetical protein